MMRPDLMLRELKRRARTLEAERSWRQARVERAEQTVEAAAAAVQRRLGSLAVEPARADHAAALRSLEHERREFGDFECALADAQLAASAREAMLSRCDTPRTTPTPSGDTRT